MSCDLCFKKQQFHAFYKSLEMHLLTDSRPLVADLPGFYDVSLCKKRPQDPVLKGERDFVLLLNVITMDTVCGGKGHFRQQAGEEMTSFTFQCPLTPAQTLSAVYFKV